MSKKIGITIFFLSAILGPLLLRAQDNNPQSLLWRISGNGLSKPSYLFGTMHVKNKKAFVFKDSLYHFIEQAEGFAMEFHPDSASQVLDAYMEGRLNFDDIPWNDEKKIDDKEVEKLISKFKKDPALSKKSTKEKINYLAEKMLVSEAEDENGMDTFMDAFLYGLAKQNGKKIFGLEQVEDQIAAFGYLAKGLKVDKLNNLLDKWDAQSSSPVYAYYYKEQLDSIFNFFSSYFSASSLKGFLYDRNIVMAQQMDSIMKDQSLFTAVGAGHLPGKEGVINLLRKKGYVVEPVFSSQSIFAGDYKVKVMADEWSKVQNYNFGFEYQMPGKIIRQNSGNGNEVSYYYDIAGGIFFMTIAGRLSSTEVRMNKDSVFDIHLQGMLEPVNGIITSRKSVQIKGLQGYEVFSSSRGNGYTKITEFFDGKRYFAFVVTAEKNEKLKGDRVDQFINSFTTLPPKAIDWQKKTVVNEGFVINFPGQSQSAVQKLSKESGISMNGHTLFDGRNGNNYGVYFSKVNAGTSFVEGDYFFSSFIDNFRENGNTPISQSDTVINGYHAKRFVTEPLDERITEGFILKRNNTSYFVSVEYDAAEKNNTAIQKFFRSFELIPFPEAEWKMSFSPGKEFSTWMPGDIRVVEKDTSTYLESTSDLSYHSFDIYAATRYTVDIKKISTYFWAENEDSVYSYWKNRITSYWSDSIISYTPVMNGSRKGRELITFDRYNKTINRTRLLLNGRELYIVALESDEGYTVQKNDSLFFAKFKIAKEEPTNDIFTTSPEKLFTDLLSKDSATFEMADKALNEVQFTPRHLDLLLKKVLLEYPVYEDIYSTVNERLLTEITRLVTEDTGKTVILKEFIKKHYTSEDRVISGLRYQLLGILAGSRTESSYQLIKQLLAAKLPAGEKQYIFFGELSEESLPFAKILYPDILSYVSDTANGMFILSLTKDLIDSGYLDVTSLEPVREKIMQIANWQLPKALKLDKDSDTYDYQLLALIELLGFFKQKLTDDMVARFIKARPLVIKKTVAIALLKNDKPVSASEINKIAADDEYRSGFYEEIKQLNKSRLFPAEFATQQQMAKSYILNQMIYMDEMDPAMQLIFIKKVEQEYKGVKQRFFLFRVVMENVEDEGEAESYLGIAGPFDVNPAKITLSTTGNISGAYYENSFNGIFTDVYFKKYLSDFLKEDK